MTIVYRDVIGYVSVSVNEYGISFCDGKAIFEDGDGKEYRVPVENLMSVENV